MQKGGQVIGLTIPGDPLGKQRHRSGRYGQYTPIKTVNYETQVRERFAACYPTRELMLGPLVIEIRAYLAIPKSATKKKRAAMLANIIRPTKKPDYDNISKIIGDALNGVAYKDDSQIVSATIHKYYSDNPRVELSVKGVANRET